MIAHQTVGHGEPVVLLNGVMMTMQSWALQTAALAAKYRCVLHDFRGQLLSDKPAGPIAMQSHVDDLVALLDALGIESAHLVGTSYGGEVAMLFALAHPSRVRSLALIACVAHADDALRAKVGRWIDAARHAPETLFETTVRDNFSADFITPQFIAAGRERLGGYPAEWFGALAALCEAALAFDVRARLHEIRCPTLVLCGEEDALKPVAHSRDIASEIPGARLVVVPGAGHAVVIEKSDAVNAAVMESTAAPQKLTAGT